MSADTRNDFRSMRLEVPSLPCPGAHLVARRIASNMMGDPAPCAESEPTSSLSKRATIHPISSSASAAGSLEASTRPFSAQNDIARLSSRPEKMNSDFAPATVLGWVSHTLSSKSTMSSGLQPSSAASVSRRSWWWGDLAASFAFSFSASAPPSSAALMLVARTGAKCCSVLGLKPALLTSRSRWMASVGMRMIGRGTFTSSCDSVSPRCTSTRPATLRSRSNQVYHSPPP
mmetsp:Transcript_818/g.1717  ORF Transcript_818/g.1717 Transcript_818/m.1717 type:complete len:231 (-) Transcript_818:619-1311(-)